MLHVLYLTHIELNLCVNVMNQKFMILSQLNYEKKINNLKILNKCVCIYCKKKKK